MSSHMGMHIAQPQAAAVRLSAMGTQPSRSPGDQSPTRKELVMKLFLFAVALLVAAPGAMAQECNQGCCPCGTATGDYLAYELKQSLDASVTVTTSLGTSNFHVNRSRRLHTPVAPLPLDSLHYLGYEVDSPTPFAPGDITINTSLGQVTGTATKVKWVVIPAAKSHSAPAPAAPTSTEAFVCFGGNNLKGPKSDVSTTDQFGSQVMGLHRVDSVCAPGTLDGSAPGTTWRVCFDAKPKPPVDPDPVWLRTVLQVINGYDLEPVDEFCVQGTL
jgi:hypothetical protein